MYARKENNIIKKYDKLPSKFNGISGNHAGGFHLLGSDIHLLEGFKPLIMSGITDPLIYKYDEIIEYSDRFEYNIVLIEPNATLESAKSKQISNLQQVADILFKETNWYYERESRTNKIGDGTIKKVPEWVMTRDEQIYNNFNTIESEILSLTTISEVVNYIIPNRLGI